MTSVPSSAAMQLQPGGTTSVASRSSTIAGPSSPAGTPRTTAALIRSPSNSASRVPARSASAPADSGSSIAGSATATRTVTSSSSASSSAYP